MIISLSRRGLLNMLFRQWHKLAAAVAFSVLVAGVYLLVAEPQYQAIASMVVKFGREARPEVASGPVTELTPNERREIVQSNVKILESRDLARQLIGELGLETLYPDIAANPPRTGSALDKALDRFHDDLVVKSSTQSNVVEVSFYHPDAALSAGALARLIDIFIARQSEVYGNPQIAFLQDQVKLARERMEASQARLRDYKSQRGVSAIDEELGLLIRRRGEVSAALKDLEARKAEAEARRASLELSLKSIPAQTILPVDSERFRSLDEARAKLFDLRAREALMAETHRPDSVLLRQLRDEVAFADQEYQARLGQMAQRVKNQPNEAHQVLLTDYSRATADRDAAAAPAKVLAENLADLERRVAELEHERNNIVDLGRQASLDEEHYRTYAHKLEEARVANQFIAERITRISLIEQPVQPSKPSRPRRLLVMMAALMGGLLLGLMAAVLAESFDERFSAPEQLAEAAGVPVLASFGMAGGLGVASPPGPPFRPRRAV